MLKFRLLIYIAFTFVSTFLFAYTPVDLIPFDIAKAIIIFETNRNDSKEETFIKEKLNQAIYTYQNNNLTESLENLLLIEPTKLSLDKASSYYLLIAIIYDLQTKFDLAIENYSNYFNTTSDHNFKKLVLQHLVNLTYAHEKYALTKLYLYKYFSIETNITTEYKLLKAELEFLTYSNAVAIDYLFSLSDNSINNSDKCIFYKTAMNYAISSQTLNTNSIEVFRKIENQIKTLIDLPECLNEIKINFYNYQYQREQKKDDKDIQTYILELKKIAQTNTKWRASAYSLLGQIYFDIYTKSKDKKDRIKFIEYFRKSIEQSHNYLFYNNYSINAIEHMDTKSFNKFNLAKVLVWTLE